MKVQQIGITDIVIMVIVAITIMGTITILI